MNQNLTFTLAFNLVSETESAVKRLYQQNNREDFIHVIVDCGFPLILGDVIPDKIEEAKEVNSITLQDMAERYGSAYLKIQNEGVSQNWTKVWEYFKPDDTDVMTCVEPDEQPIEPGWITALGNVLRLDTSLGFAAPTLIDHKEMLKRNRHARLKRIGIYDVYIMTGNINYGLLAISGRLLNKMQGVPVPPITSIYGNIEHSLLDAIRKHGYQWCLLKDYCEIHTNVPILYRKWKDDCIFGEYKTNQIPFEDWLIKQKNK